MHTLLGTSALWDLDVGRSFLLEVEDLLLHAFEEGFVGSAELFRAPSSEAQGRFGHLGNFDVDNSRLERRKRTLGLPGPM